MSTRIKTVFVVILLSLTLFLSPTNSQAQEGGQVTRFGHLTAEDGLSGNAVLAILKDRVTYFSLPISRATGF